MGTFQVTLEVGDPLGQRFVSVRALVDSGATYTWIPRGVLEDLEIRPTRQFPFVLADGRRITREMGETQVRYNGTVVTTLVIFGDPETVPLLGAYTMEGLGLAPDPINQRLVETPGLLMSAIIS